MTPTPTGLFALLPNELISKVAALLPITDVLSLKKATHNSLEVLTRRIDLSSYLQAVGPFSQTRNLLQVMATHGAVLSGSRALEYFVPGSITGASDWDFFVPSVPVSIAAVKHALESSGVTFESCLVRAAQKLRDESSVNLTRNEMISIAYEANSSTRLLTREQQIIVRALHSTYPVLQNIAPYIRRNGSVRWISDISPLSIGECGQTSPAWPQETMAHEYPGNIAAKVLYGTARKGLKIVSIQLVAGTIDPRRSSLVEPLFQTVFRSIFSFYGSHVQCILTRHVAFHMYYRLAMEKAAYSWRVPEAIRERADTAVQKYISRGFEFREIPEDEWVFRSAVDEDSCLIELDNSRQCFPPLSQIKEIQWVHSGGVIRPLLPPETRDARHELLHYGMVHRI